MQKLSQNKKIGKSKVKLAPELIKLGLILLSGMLAFGVLSLVIFIWGDTKTLKSAPMAKVSVVEKVETTTEDATPVKEKKASKKKKADKTRDKEEKKKAKGEGNLVYYPGRTFDYGSKFNDINETHLSIATEKGLSAPLKTNKEVDKNKRKLKKIKTTRNYVVDNLDYSLPYLTKGAAQELDVIGADFADILKRNNLPHYRFIVTSVLRTEESVKGLQNSGNINATTNSAHCYGTTFDITYKRFDKKDRSKDCMTEENLKLVLGQALLNEQRAGHIYVKYEVKQSCFHITSRL